MNKVNNNNRKLQLSDDTMLQINNIDLGTIIGGAAQDQCLCGCGVAQDQTCPGNQNPGFYTQCSCNKDK